MIGIYILCLMAVMGASFIATVATMQEGNIASVRGIHVFKIIGIVLVFWIPLALAIAHIEALR